MKQKWLMENWRLPLLITIFGVLFTVWIGGSQGNKNTTNNSGNGSIYNQPIVNADGSSVNVSITNNVPMIEDKRIQNERDEDILHISDDEIVQKYFELLNFGEIKRACSLLNLS